MFEDLGEKKVEGRFMFMFQFLEKEFYVRFIYGRILFFEGVLYV